jgi:hypothetical protein
MRARRYIDQVLTPEVIPFFARHGPGLTLQQDNARPHVARITTAHLCQPTAESESDGEGISRRMSDAIHRRAGVPTLSLHWSRFDNLQLVVIVREKPKMGVRVHM